MTSKLALHVQGHESWTRRSRARYIKVIDPSGDNKWPNHRVIGRVYVPDGVSNEIVARGSVGARVWLEHCLRAAETAPYVWMWLAPNEPQPMVSLDFCQRLSEFTGEWAHMMREQGLRAGGGTISEGNPPGATEDEIRKRVEAFAPGLSQCDAWLYHGYWVEKAQHREAGITVWHALRYRMIYQFAKDAGYTLPTCFIGECGNDGGVIGDKGRGWRTYCGGDRRAYMQELARFDAELAKDPYVEAAFVFTAGANNDWRDFEVDEQLGDLINEHITAQGGAYVPTAPSAPPPLGELLRAEFGADYEDLSRSLPRHATLVYHERALSAIDRIVLHHTEASKAATWQSVAQYHVNSNGWPGIGYHIGVRSFGGKVMVSLLNDPRTRSYHAHTVGNDHGLAVCVAGKFDTDRPSDAEQDALRRVVATVRRWRSALPVVAHGDVPGNSTECPGRYLRALLPALNTPYSLHDLVLHAADAAQVIQFNPNAALQRRIFADGFVPNSPEFEVEHGGIRYIVQRAEHLASGEVRAYYVPLGDWANVQHVTR